MYFLGLGLLLLALKYIEFAPVAQWSWWVVLSPFALAVLWWSYADATGYSKRRAMEKDDKRKADRVERQRKSIGMPPSKRGR